MRRPFGTERAALAGEGAAGEFFGRAAASAMPTVGMRARECESGRRRAPARVQAMQSVGARDTDRPDDPQRSAQGPAAASAVQSAGAGDTDLDRTRTGPHKDRLCGPCVAGPVACAVCGPPVRVTEQ